MDTKAIEIDRVGTVMTNHRPAAAQHAEWRLGEGVDQSLIYDVGMNTGQDTQYYLALGYRVLAVEAEPTLVAAARQRFAPEISAGRLKIVHCAIAEQEGTIPFWVFPDRNGWNTMDRLQAEQNIAMGFRC